MNLFENGKKLLIGMVHLKPLVGYDGFISVDDVAKNAISDALKLKKAGFNTIMLENNYDTPHKEFISKENEKCFNEVVKKVREAVGKDVILGINALWNDHKAGLRIAKENNCKFIRVAVFVDHVRTSYGDILGDADRVIKFRKELDAEDICLFTDIQVKHSTLLNVRPIEESALEAIEKGSDGLIVTGRWTGDAPNLNKLLSVRKAVKDFPILVGSGATEDNLSDLLEYANAIIVGTALKTGKIKDKSEEVNLKSYDERIDLEESKSFAKKFAGCINS